MHNAISDRPETPHATPDGTSARRATGRSITRVIGAVFLFAVVFMNGSPGLDAPWMIGDEFNFIAENPDVTMPAGGPLLEHCLELYTRPQEDLYQPTVIAFYAVLWRFFGDSPWHFRLADLALHALNAVLVWLVLLRMTRLFATHDPHLIDANATPAAMGTRSSPGVGLPARATSPPLITVMVWLIALAWAVHPVQIGAYCGDMATPHLLTGVLVLIALLLHVRSFTSGPGWNFAIAVIVLFFANASKPAPGYALVIAAIEAVYFGWRAALRSARVWTVAVISALFAILTVLTTRQSGLLDEASAGLFGDPVSRSFLALWYYVRNTFAPLWLSPWYLPDPHTGWSHPLVWAGFACGVVFAAHAIWSWRSGRLRTLAIGWAWIFGGLLPILGFVGARQAIAFDRYLYQPLIGFALILAYWLHQTAARRAGRPAPLQLGVVAALFVICVLAIGTNFGVLSGSRNVDPRNSPIVAARDSLARATRVAALNPGDPRMLEMLAATYSFARDHTLPAYELTAIPDADPAHIADQQYRFFNAKFVAVLRAASQTDVGRYYPDNENRARFHRRLAAWFTSLGSAPEALANAEASRQLAPNNFNTWLALARAYRLAGRWADAKAAYEKRETLLPADPKTRAVQFIEHGDLLLKHLNAPQDAKPKYEAAIATGQMTTPAIVGLALCEIRGGLGSKGFDLLQNVLKHDPKNPDARVALGEYHLRSHHWKEAGNSYADLLAERPAQLEALLGLHEVCNQTGEWGRAVHAWERALMLEPENRTFRSFYVWAAACAADPAADDVANELLKVDPRNPMALLSKMLIELRTAHLAEAISWINQAKDAASAGEYVPYARPFDRAFATIRILRDRGAVRSESLLAEAALDLVRGNREAAQTAADNYLRNDPSPKWREIAESLIAQAKATP